MDILRDYALTFVGIPYRWGGSNPMTGFDCSGLIQELLSSVGIDPIGDQSAQALFEYFRENGRYNEMVCGTLIFYGKDLRNISHVAMMIDHNRIIEAGGGDSRTTTLEAAIVQNAFVRVRHIRHRKDIIAIIRPRYDEVGLL